MQLQPHTNSRNIITKFKVVHAMMDITLQVGHWAHRRNSHHVRKVYRLHYITWAGNHCTKIRNSAIRTSGTILLQIFIDCLITIFNTFRISICAECPPSYPSSHVCLIIPLFPFENKNSSRVSFIYPSPCQWRISLCPIFRCLPELKCHLR